LLEIFCNPVLQSWCQQSGEIQINLIEAPGLENVDLIYVLV